MITTIQLNKNVKKALDSLKSGKQTYEDIIISLLESVEKNKRKQEQALIEECKAMADENKKITNEFESIEDLNNWEW